MGGEPTPPDSPSYAGRWPFTRCDIPATITHFPIITQLQLKLSPVPGLP